MFMSIFAGSWFDRTSVVPTNKHTLSAETILLCVRACEHTQGLSYWEEDSCPHTRTHSLPHYTNVPHTCHLFLHTRMHIQYTESETIWGGDYDAS